VRNETSLFLGCFSQNLLNLRPYDKNDNDCCNNDDYFQSFFFLQLSPANEFIGEISGFHANRSPSILQTSLDQIHDIIYHRSEVTFQYKAYSSCPMLLVTIEQEEVTCMSILPEGEQLRRAVKWISDMRVENPGISLSKLVGDACLKFDLPPKDAEFLSNFFVEKSEQQ
jgi:hypothetical protein